MDFHIYSTSAFSNDPQLFKLKIAQSYSRVLLWSDPKPVSLKFYFQRWLFREIGHCKKGVNLTRYLKRIFRPQNTMNIMVTPCGFFFFFYWCCDRVDNVSELLLVTKNGNEPKCEIYLTKRRNTSPRALACFIGVKKTHRHLTLSRLNRNC